MELEVLRIFADVFRARSFAGVARDRNVDPSTISRAVAALEAELGARLFQRTTRELTPTEAASQYFARVAPALSELELAAATLGDADTDARGTLRITAAVTFAETNVVPLLPAFAARHPALSFELLLTNNVLDMVAHRIDLALRVGRLADSTHVSQKLCDMTYAVCASGEYLQRRGTPRHPEELAEHDCLLYPNGTGTTWWRFRRDEEALTVPVRGRVLADNGAALRTCAVAGMGIVMLPTWNLAGELASGALVRLLPGWEMTLDQFGSAAWAVYPTRSYVPRKVRLFLDFLKESFAAGAPAERLARTNGAGIAALTRGAAGVPSE